MELPSSEPSWLCNEGDPLLSVRIGWYPCQAGTVCFRWYPVGAGGAWIKIETDGSSGTRIGTDSNGHERICPEVHDAVIASRGVVQFLNGTAVERAELVVQRG